MKKQPKPPVFRIRYDLAERERRAVLARRAKLTLCLLTLGLLVWALALARQFNLLP
jgi:hypothetical protein